MNKITTDFVGTESRAEVKTRLQAILDYWLGPGSTAGVSTWGDIRTLLNSVATPNYQIADGEVASSFRTKLNVLNTPDQHIASFFEQAGSQGWFYDLSDMSTLFQEAAGITPVTAVGQPVGLCLDKSKGLVLGPELVTNGDFSSGATGWTPGTNWTISGGAATTTGANSDNITGRPLTQSSTLVVGRLYEVSVELVANNFTGTVCALRFQDQLNANSNILTVTPSTPLGVYRARLVAVGPNIVITNSSASPAGSFTIDNISVRELLGNHRSQSASLPRPTYARHPLGGIRNLLTFTEEFDNAAWNKTNTTVTANAGVAPDGTMTADAVVENTANASHEVLQTVAIGAVVPHTYSTYIKTNGRAWVRLFTFQAGIVANSVWFNVATGTVGTTTAGASNVSITNVGNGWYRCSMTFTPASAANMSAYAMLASVDGGTSYTGDGTSGIFIWGAQLELGSTATPYQRVVSAFDVTEAGVPDLYYLSYDGLNDSLSTAPFAWGSDKATVVAGVRKLSDAAVGMLAEFSANINTNAGAFRLTAPATVGPSYSFGSRGNGAVIADAIISSGFAAPVTNVITGIGDISGDVSRFRVNGTQVASSTQDQGTGNFGTHAAFFGARGGTTLFFRGNEYSNVGINRLLTTGELAALESWTAGKAGNTL